ncbi:hypothetical protein BJ508DRAFT_411645 [Ascobolus immersus RN42]|uniref:C2H2-type domain-containing protein n=1 Tax=Ascobolus immersus RN42 TaxID=1160509 RepID=A0A3N4IIW1_ASCIM|nr:hypothetical protein BJ508DRAFT_411645 [Ascobolus immersus RN42]
MDDLTSLGNPSAKAASEEAVYVPQAYVPTVTVSTSSWDFSIALPRTVDSAPNYGSEFASLVSQCGAGLHRLYQASIATTKTLRKLQDIQHRFVVWASSIGLSSSEEGTTPLLAIRPADNRIQVSLLRSLLDSVQELLDLSNAAPGSFTSAIVGRDPESSSESDDVAIPKSDSEDYSEDGTGSDRSIEGDDIEHGHLSRNYSNIELRKLYGSTQTFPSTSGVSTLSHTELNTDVSGARAKDQKASRIWRLLRRANDILDRLNRYTVHQQPMKADPPTYQTIQRSSEAHAGLFHTLVSRSFPTASSGFLNRLAKTVESRRENLQSRMLAQSYTSIEAPFCPYCGQVFAIPVHGSSSLADAPNVRMIKEHVLTHIQPYVCLFPDCNLSEAYFDTFEQCLSHMQWRHTLLWCCPTPTHQDSLYDKPEHLIEHFRRSHSGRYTARQMRQLLRSSGKPAPDTFQVLAESYQPRNAEKIEAHDAKLSDFCPFCNNFDGSMTPGECFQLEKSSDKLQTSANTIEVHIQRHMEKLAIMSLPDQALSALKLDALGNSGQGQYRPTVSMDEKLGPGGKYVVSDHPGDASGYSTYLPLYNTLSPNPTLVTTVGQNQAVYSSADSGFGYSSSRPRPCEVPGCEVVIKRDADWHRHIREAHPEAEANSRPYECSVCDQKFRRRGQLSDHQRRRGHQAIQSITFEV